MSLDVGNLRFILSLQLCSPSNIPSDCVNVNLSKVENEVSFFFSAACLSVTLYCIHFMNQLKSLFLFVPCLPFSIHLLTLLSPPPHSRRFSFSPAVSLFIILSLSYTSPPPFSLSVLFIPFFLPVFFPVPLFRSLIVSHSSASLPLVLPLTPSLSLLSNTKKTILG